MAIEPRKQSQLANATSIAANTTFMVVQSGNNFQISATNLFANLTFANTAFNLARINYSVTPANSSALTISRGYMWADADYLYVSTANNTVKRVALDTF